MARKTQDGQKFSKKSKKKLTNDNGYHYKKHARKIEDSKKIIKKSEKNKTFES